MADNNPFPGENNTGHVWDDNLRELKNPIPRWWMIGFWASCAWFLLYIVLYPSIPMGSKPNKGLLGWTMIEEYKEGLAEVEAVRAEFEEKINGMTAKQILADPGLGSYTEASAKVLFGDKCAPCHGSGGQGGPGFPVIADDDWLFGGSIEKIEETITKGRKAVMPAQAKVLSSGEIDILVNYVVGLGQGKVDEQGKALFAQKACFACHGPDGKGLQAVGSANLTDKIWRFIPGGAESAKQTITHGVNDANDAKTREAVMPAFEGKLSPSEIKKLAVYVYKFGGGQ